MLVAGKDGLEKGRKIIQVPHNKFDLMHTSKLEKKLRI